MAVALGGVDHVANDQVGDAGDGEFGGYARGEIEEVGLGVLHAPLAGEGAQMFFMGMAGYAMKGPDERGDAEERREEEGWGELKHGD